MLRASACRRIGIEPLCLNSLSADLARAVRIVRDMSQRILHVFQSFSEYRHRRTAFFKVGKVISQIVLVGFSGFARIMRGDSFPAAVFRIVHSQAAEFGDQSLFFEFEILFVFFYYF